MVLLDAETLLAHLQVLCYLAPLFPKNIGLFWQDEVYNDAFKIFIRNGRFSLGLKF